MKRRFLALSVLAMASLAACGGGGGSSTTPTGSAAVVPTATPVPASASAFSVSDAVPIPAPPAGASSVDIGLPSDPGTGAAASATFPGTGNVPADTAIDATFTSSADGSLPTISPVTRAPRDNPPSMTVGFTASSPAPSIPGIAFLRVRFSATVSLPQAPGFTFVVPGTLPTAGLTYWLALLDPLRDAAGWQKNFAGPAAVSAITVNGNHPATKLVFPSNGQPVTFQAHETYWLAIVAINTATGNPTPVPSSVPSNAPHVTPPAPVVASPPALVFAGATSMPLAVTFSQNGNTSGFQLRGTCTGIANTTASSPTFTVAPVGTGRCELVGLGDKGAAAVVHVAVGVPLAPPSPYPTPKPPTGATPSPSPSPKS